MTNEVKGVDNHGPLCHNCLRGSIAIFIGEPLYCGQVISARSHHFGVKVRPRGLAYCFFKNGGGEGESVFGRLGFVEPIAKPTGGSVFILEGERGK